MSTQPATSKSRTQSLLLAAVAGLLAVDVSIRLTDNSEAKPSASEQTSTLPVTYQPEPDPVDILANPLAQRRAMIDQLKSIDRRLMSLESRLDGNLRVEVTNFPKVQPETD